MWATAAITNRMSTAGVNAYGAPAGFGHISGAAPPNPSFATATEVLSNAVSNYNGVTASVVHRSKSLLLQFNYTWSHALDEISNGGILGFNAGQSATGTYRPVQPGIQLWQCRLRRRGNNFTGSYVYSVPYWRGPHAITDGWQLTGTVFHHSGFPFTVNDSAVTNSIANYPSGASRSLLKQLRNVSHCGSSAVFNHTDRQRNAVRHHKSSQLHNADWLRTAGTQPDHCARLHRHRFGGSEKLCHSEVGVSEIHRGCAVL